MKYIVFKDYPEFQPNISPEQMFNMGIMGGSYFRPIRSPNTGKTYKNEYRKFPFLQKMPLYKYANPVYDQKINKYNEKVGTSYEFWIMKGWIDENTDPYGWIQWYCNFWLGRRTDDDKRQIKRWKNIAGKNGRFRKQLQNKINSIGSNDENIYKRMRQTLLHWGYDTSKMKPEPF
jgi:hypothetical protein